MFRHRFLLVIAVIVLLTSSLCTAESHDKTWGIGYDKYDSYNGGLTIRRWLGANWELGLSAAPEDMRTETRSLDWGDGIDLEDAIEDIPDNESRESGWVRMILGRPLMRHDDLRLMLDLGLRYKWADSRSYRRTYNEYSEYTRITIDDEFEERWSLTLDLRPSFDITSAMSFEARFGLEFEWESARGDRMEREIDAEGVVEEYRLTTTERQSFDSYGWSGLGSLSFIFWF